MLGPVFLHAQGSVRLWERWVVPRITILRIPTSLTKFQRNARAGLVRGMRGSVLFKLKRRMDTKLLMEWKTCPKLAWNWIRMDAAWMQGCSPHEVLPGLNHIRRTIWGSPIACHCQHHAIDDQRGHVHGVVLIFQAATISTTPTYFVHTHSLAQSRFSLGVLVQFESSSASSSWFILVHLGSTDLPSILRLILR